MSSLNVDYMAYPPIAELEAKIKAGSHDGAIDDMWLNIAPMYFPLTDGFTTTVQSRLRDSSGQMSDVGVRKFINEHRRNGQLQQYLEQTRAEEALDKTLFGIITIGKASQFFSLPFNQPDLHCLHNDSVAYTFKNNQGDVDHWMTYIRQQILAGN